jgi:hypothetical protein
MDYDLDVLFDIAFAVEDCVDAGQGDALIEKMRPDVLMILKEAIADWELAHAGER